MTDDSDKTRIFNYGNPSSKKKSQKDDDETRVFKRDEGGEETIFNDHLNTGGSHGGSDQTIIFGKETGGESDKKTAKRKLVGWLVSFTLDEAGTDFRLFEGKNKLGRNQSNDIRIFQDGKISGEHAVILFRGDDFYVKDEMASNPSYLNDVEIEPGQTVKVTDGDKLKFGDNTFIIRSARAK